ncbi:MAG: winged helix-turn-helix transcriptional regulator [Alphaproteobacteria bacterium]|jgi:MarR family transcriptional regulator, lower aerobic nicotinate degradation pathway regulator|nr:winged helix-turn-helix transcriptional regulator [Alphaproteobacteria bacterium]MBT5162089.1 winged helix-turn-helix transcriptional regulator [Alphaproteobacteria bacterium]MBT5918227.1 winged helix-turn-helix transcriptional regulator [Alphaproteobacteria bacterium]MBT6386122.1 winged helix-turn-helix transcriptional regulator [Alphaproteobacteria bacterium]
MTEDRKGYALDDQVGFILREVGQRHSTIFAGKMIERLTPTQFAAMAKLIEVGDCSQNQLGRHTAMDVATIKGVVDRLAKRGFVDSHADDKDARRRIVCLTDTGRDVALRAIQVAGDITRETLKPLSEAGQKQLLKLLRELR